MGTIQISEFFNELLATRYAELRIHTNKNIKIKFSKDNCFRLPLPVCHILLKFLQCSHRRAKLSPCMPHIVVHHMPIRRSFTRKPFQIFVFKVLFRVLNPKGGIGYSVYNAIKHEVKGPFCDSLMLFL